MDEFPRYVLEYLIDNYCSEETFDEDLEQVMRRLRENLSTAPRPRRSAHYIRENRAAHHHRQPGSAPGGDRGQILGRISAINESFVNIPEALVRQYPMLLSGGMWGTIDLTYDETEVHNKKIRPFKVLGLHPVPDFDDRPATSSSRSGRSSRRRVAGHPDQLLWPRSRAG